MLYPHSLCSAANASTNASTNGSTNATTDDYDAIADYDDDNDDYDATADDNNDSITRVIARRGRERARLGS